MASNILRLFEREERLAGTPVKHQRQNSSCRSPTPNETVLQPACAGSDLAKRRLSVPIPSVTSPDPTAADKDDASVCSTEYPESEVSLGDCLLDPDAAAASPGRADAATAVEVAPTDVDICPAAADVQKWEAAEADKQEGASQQERQQDCLSISKAAEDAPPIETQYPEFEESFAEDFREPAPDVEDPPWSIQNQERQDLLPEAPCNSIITATAADPPEQQAEDVAGTQYPDWEDDESANSEADAAPCLPAPDSKQEGNGLRDNNKGLSDKSKEDAVPTATQYPDIEDDDLPPQGAVQEAPPNSHTSPQAEVQEDEALIATQYPDIEDDDIPHPVPAQAASDLQEPPQNSSRVLQADAAENEAPTATQYPDLDEEDSLSQSQPQQHVRAEPEEDIAPDAHSDFDAELDEFLAEQVFHKANR